MKNIVTKIAIVALLFAAGCSLKDPVVGNGKQVTIRLEDAQNTKIEKGEFSLLATPTVTADFACFTLNVTGGGIAPRLPQGAYNCQTPLNFQGRGQGIVVPPFRRGTATQLDLPAGPGRTIDVWGLYPPASECGLGESQGPSAGYFLGGVTRDILESTSVTIPISYSTSVLNDLLTCPSGGGTTSVTKYILIAGGTTGTEAFQMEPLNGSLSKTGDQAVAGSSFTVSLGAPVVYFTTVALTATTLIVNSNGSLSVGSTPGVIGGNMIPFVSFTGAYLWLNDTSSMYSYSVDSSTAALGSQNSELSALSSAGNFYVDPTNQFGFFTISPGYNIQYATVNSANGHWNAPGGPVTTNGLANVSSFVANPSGTKLYAGLASSYVQEFTINQGTAALTNVTALPGGSNKLAMDPQGRWLYAIPSSGSSIYVYPISAGLSSPTPYSILTGSDPIAIAADPTGQYVYVKFYTGNTIQRIAIDSGGVATSLGSTSTSASYPNGTFMGFTKVVSTQ